MNCGSLITALFCLVAWSSAWTQTWKPVTVPGTDVAQRTTGIGWYRCWVKVPDNWATLGGRDLWVESVTLTIDSSREIREGYEHMQVQTRDGRRLSGFLSDQTKRLLILRGIDGSDTLVEQAQVKSTRISPRSLMPESLLNGLTDQQLRDFFAYLRIAQPIRN